MESRFAHLRERDTTVSMLRVKMSRRRSQSQKENRERAVNSRRQLDKLPELEISSQDASIAMANMSTIQEKAQIGKRQAKSSAVLEERLKQLERWKERKTLMKEKEKREKDRKGVFRTGLYHPKDTFTILPLPAAPVLSRPKERNVNKGPSQSTRVTRSMKAQKNEVQKVKPLKMLHPNTRANKVQPAVERSARAHVAAVKPLLATTKTNAGYPAASRPAASTRSASRPLVTKAPVVKDNPKAQAADVRTTRSRAVFNSLAPSAGDGGESEDMTSTLHPADNIHNRNDMNQEPEEIGHISIAEEKAMDVDLSPEKEIPAAGSEFLSFAPEGFVFQAPAGLSSFKFEPLTPRSADAFLTPSSSFNLPPAPTIIEPQIEPKSTSPQKSLHCSPSPPPPRMSPIKGPSAPGSPLESKHDVPYFRSEIAGETKRLTKLSLHWEAKVEDESIPEEMRDRMRTAIGQARLLMKERFNQFSGLVDDCDLGRGEKPITCTDLQGFWDMVYYQVEDVNKKFDALKEAEARNWVEEHKPPPRQRKVAKKSAAPAKPTGTKVAAKSRLAAVKAAIKAKQQAAEAEKAVQDAADTDYVQPQMGVQTLDTVVFNGGFFQVESPAKPLVRRSSRLSAALLPQASPSSSYRSPRRLTRRSLALKKTPLHASPAQAATPSEQIRLTMERTPGPNSRHGTPQNPQNSKDTVNSSLGFSPVNEIHSDEGHTEKPKSPPVQAETVTAPEPTGPMHVLPIMSVEKEDELQSEETMTEISPCKLPSFETSEPPSTPGLMPHVAPDQTPATSPIVEGIPGLDIERYLQPSSPMEADVEMESPRSPAGDLLSQQQTALSTVSSVFTLQSPQVSRAESAVFLFTPDLKDRIRQSTCPSDLMMFTP